MDGFVLLSLSFLTVFGMCSIAFLIVSCIEFFSKKERIRGAVFMSDAEIISKLRNK